MEKATTPEEQKKTSAITLSDMEMFIFPELMYSLMLANILSPRIWGWLDDPWFADLDKMTPYRRLTRVKQFIMDHYVFNLDLDTWGLTTTEQETERFRGVIGSETLAKSNALFGYEGDKYYFDIDIRTHFGLDKYRDNIIPYWKTETVEAMDAFQYRENYSSGAGECVSLAALYAAAFFVVARIPLSDIYLMATPLHSQNFIDVNEGVLTNNRRLVTKKMWFNGTALSAQARRALDNERVTIVTHESGVIHTIYPDATIDPQKYEHFCGQLRNYLRTKLDREVLGNFVRHAIDIQKCFQLRWPLRGRDHYIGVEKALAYEYGSSYRITDDTREKLMNDVDVEQFEPRPLPSRIILNDLEDFVKANNIDIAKAGDLARLKEQFASDCLNAELALESLCKFCSTTPRLPDPTEKTFHNSHEPLNIAAEMGREKILERLESIRGENTMADMAFYAFRDLNRVEAAPFLQASVQRNPVSVSAAEDWTEAEMVTHVNSLVNESIYDGPGRLAQPDEVWNFSRGDGAEKACLLANLLRGRYPDAEMTIQIDGTEVVLMVGDQRFAFPSEKELTPQTWDIPHRG